jgi:endo-alpha-1,4-polygalactosaminidase (GH114 family)
MYISNKDYEKIEYLLGFVNSVAEVVCNPEEMLDPNTGDSTVFAIGCSVDDDTLELSTLESDDAEDFRENLLALEKEIKPVLTVDYSKQWEELRG